MPFLRTTISTLAAATTALAAALGVAAPLALSTQAHASATENRPFSASDVFNQEHSYARSPRQWTAIQQMLDKPAPRLEVDPFIAMSDEFPARRWNEYRGQILVLDFWGTWCGPCIRGMPKTSEFARKYKDKGVTVLGICNQNRGETMVETGKQAGMTFPTAFDRHDRARAAYGVQWWPYYVIIDREGIVRAAGVSPAHIETVVDGILRYQPNPSEAPATEADQPGTEAADETAPAISSDWFEGTERARRRLNRIEGQPAPVLAVERWLNTEEPLDAEKLRGKVVMVSFWATWCRHCHTAVPTLNELQEKYADQGLVLIGVCAQRGHETMGEKAAELGMRFPIAADTIGRTARDYRVDGYPDYYFIDRTGKLRVADVKNANIEDVIKVLLAEPTPKPEAE